MVNQDSIAINAEILCEDNLAVICCFDGVMSNDRKVEADMILLVDALPLVDVCPAIGEVGFNLRITQLKEGAVPQELRRRLFRQHRDGLMDLFSEYTDQR